MSLDVFLIDTQYKQPTREQIFIREDGRTFEITREEWDSRYPNREPYTIHTDDSCVFHGNITHNLARMAEEAELYVCIWQPQDYCVFRAYDLIIPLTKGLSRLISYPEKYTPFNSPNGWGSYETLIAFVRSYIAACVKYPNATVSVSR
jgi:hypothetical protein